MIEVKRIAKDFITSYFKVSEDFFEIAWDFIDKHYEEISSLGKPAEKLRQLGAPLAFGGFGEEEQQGVIVFFIFVGAHKQISITEKAQDLMPIIQGACQHFQIHEKLQEQIVQRMSSIDEKMEKILEERQKGLVEGVKPEEKEKSEYRVWYKDSEPEGETIGKQKYDELIKNKSNYKIFIIDHGEYEMGSVGEIYLDDQLILKEEHYKDEKHKEKKEKDYLTPYEYKLLVYTLKNGFRAGTIIDLVEKCWGKKALVDGPTGLRKKIKKDKDTFMRETSTYRKTIANLSNLLYDKIGVKLRSYRTGSYNLTERPKFCLLEIL